MAGYIPDSIYIYHPNKGAPVFFAVAFSITGFVHLWQCYRYKSWKWTFLHPLSCFMFAFGFVLREYGAFNYSFTKSNVSVYIASVCLIYMAPPLLELANYHVLGRTMYYVPYLSPIHPGRVLTTFGILSSVVEALNAIGVSYSANNYLPDRYIQLGHALMKASLIVQLVVIMLFAVLATHFHRACHKNGVLNRKVRTPLVVLYVSMGLIFDRTIYRTVEYFLTPSVSTASGFTQLSDINPILREEWFFYVFEAMLMAVNSAIWNVWHPGRFLPVDKNVYLERDGVTEVQGTGTEDDRSFLITLIDPFGWFLTSSKKTSTEGV